MLNISIIDYRKLRNLFFLPIILSMDPLVHSRLNQETPPMFSSTPNG